MLTAVALVAGTLCAAPVRALEEPAPASLPGVREIAVTVPHHDRAVEGFVWYPAHRPAGDPDGEGEIAMLGENAVFVGSPARVDAVPRAGRYPLVLLSHGLNGHVLTLRWLAHALVEAGVVVLGVNHPNSTVFDRDLALGMAHWTRALDLRHALDRLLADPELGSLVDPTRIHAAGFSYGGWTALSLGGLRGELSAYASHCDVDRERSSHCADLARGGLDLRTLDAEAWGADLRDDRVRSVVAIDPGLLFGLAAEHATDLIDDVLLIGLGAGEDRLYATDFGPEGSGFAELAGADVVRIAPAYHFSMLPLCKPGGASVLKAENDDPVCTDPPAADRADVHRRVIDAFVEHLGLGADGGRANGGDRAESGRPDREAPAR